MFSNLIESSSHAREFKRRGSFVLFTSATYALLFVVAGVASIYAYDARLDYPNTEIVTMLSPLDLPAAPAAPHNAAPAPSNASRNTLPMREVAMANVNQPIVPTIVSAAPNVHLPAPPGPYVIGTHDYDPVGVGGPDPNGHGSNSSSTGTVAHAVEVSTPPPPPAVPVHQAPPRVVSKGPITGLAILLPKPAYPPLAKQAGAHGPVMVQVLVDENGKVISAKAVSGHPLLMAAAQQAAYSARFSPTRLGDQAVKVSGMITYNFVLQ